MKFYAPFFLLITLLLLSCTQDKGNSDYKKIFEQAVRKYKSAEKKDTKGDEHAIKVLKKEIRQVNHAFSAYALSLVADSLAGKNYYTAAYRCYRLSIELADRETSKLIIGYDKLKMAQIEIQVGDYHSGQNSAIEALPYFDGSTDEPKYDIEINNTIGISFELLGDYEMALNHYTKVNKLPNDEINHIILDNNIAHVYAVRKRFDLALPLFRKLLSKKVLMESSTDYALVKDNYGYALFQHNPDDGEKMLLEGKVLREKNSMICDLPSSYLHLSDFYAEKNQAKALQYADQAYTAAAMAGSPDEKLAALATKIRINKGKENGNSPLLYVNLNDSLTHIRSTAKNTFAKLRYDKSEAEYKNAKNEARALIFAIFSLLVISLSVFIWYKTKKNRQLTEQRTSARIAKKIHDEVANDMFQAMAFAEHEDLSKDHIREILLDNLEDIYSKTRDISKDNSYIDTGEGFPGELRALINAFVGIHTKIVIAGLEQVDWDKASVATKFTAYRIVQEWLVNMKKHSNAALVVLNFKKTGKFLEVLYTDNGIGSDKKPNSGLQNAENRTKQLKGTLNFETAPGKGFRATLQIPF